MNLNQNYYCFLKWAMISVNLTFSILIERGFWEVIFKGSQVTNRTAKLLLVLWILLPPWASLVSQTVKNLPAKQEKEVWSLSWEVPLEKEMVTHSNILACRIPWTKEPDRLLSIGSQSQTRLSAFHCTLHYLPCSNPANLVEILPPYPQEYMEYTLCVKHAFLTKCSHTHPQIREFLKDYQIKHCVHFTPK